MSKLEWKKLDTLAYATDAAGNDWTIRFDGYDDCNGTHLYGDGMLLIKNDERVASVPMKYNSGELVGEFKFDVEAYMKSKVEQLMTAAEEMIAANGPVELADKSADRLLRERMEKMTTRAICEAIAATWHMEEGAFLREVGFAVIEEREGEARCDTTYSDLWRKCEGTE